ncbi:MAG: hypothetical protein JSS82_12510 [Bacteroidetes bacterium]|nr:hypothetical protein [Bacteroidota bacterium]
MNNKSMFMYQYAQQQALKTQLEFFTTQKNKLDAFKMNLTSANNQDQLYNLMKNLKPAIDRLNESVKDGSELRLMMENMSYATKTFSKSMSSGSSSSSLSPEANIQAEKAYADYVLAANEAARLQLEIDQDDGDDNRSKADALMY